GQPPRTVRRVAGSRIDDVVELDSAAPPATHPCARAGHGTGLKDDPLGGGVHGFVAVVTDLNHPPSWRGLPGNSDLAAEADHHAAVTSERLQAGNSAEVRGQCLGGGAEIDLDPSGKRHAAADAV